MDTSLSDAVAVDLMTGKVAWAQGAEVIGSLTDQTWSPDSSSLATGVYPVAVLSSVDPDLSAENLASGTNVFGVIGTMVVTDTSTANAVATQLILGAQPGSMVLK